MADAKKGDELPPDVAAIRDETARFFDTPDAKARKIYQKVLAESTLGAVLNEKYVTPSTQIELPPSFRQRIIPASIYEQRKHPDVRIARRASTIANLARVISERSVSQGLRRTLLTQARRLELLASRRLAELGIKGSPPTSPPGSP